MHNVEKKQSKKSIFLSLKWSALLSLSLVLLMVNSFFYFYHSASLVDDFESERQLVLMRNGSQIQSLIEQSKNYLEQLGEIIPSMYGVDGALRNNDNANLVRGFDAHWASLQIQTDIDTAIFYSANSELINSWGDQTLLQPQMLSKVENTLQKMFSQLSPVFEVICDNICRQYAFVPVLSNGATWGGIILGRSLADPIINFSRTLNVDIGIIDSNNLVEADQFSSIKQLANIKQLPHWSARLMALSRVNDMYPVLLQLQTVAPLFEVLAQGSNIHIDDRVYEVKMKTLGDNTGVYIVFIEDITELLAQIDEENNEVAITGLLSAIFSELALLLILWVPLSNLRKTSEVIPLLAASEFSKARAQVKKTHQDTLFKDEIDILDETIIELSSQLEALEDNVETRSKALAAKIHELTSERDFINRLLNTAQVIIITHDIQGKIILTNKQATIVTGYSACQLMEKKFLDLAEDSPSNTIMLLDSYVRQVAEGKILTHKNESTLRCMNGELRAIAWLHSHLDVKMEDEAAVLSVGLDVSERKAYEKEISWLADHDSLTGLHNRRRFNEILKSALTVASRYKHQVGLLFLDLDNFKHVNDTLGHQTGDLLIKSVADCLQLILRESDHICRLGGDEFAIILPIVTEEHAIDVATKINKHLSSLRLPMVDSNHRATASIGVAMYPDHATNAKDLLSNADLAMYQAKARGRGCWHMYAKSDNIKERMETQLFWRHKISNALAEDKFALYFQPILNISEGTISHYEVLLRMRDGEGDLILPTPFIDVAEKAGLIHDIDHMVLRKSIDELKKQNDINHRMVLSINLSAHSFSDPELLSLLKGLIELTKIDTSQIIFEITETAALADLGGAVRLISKIRELGCRFALDDFGVGFSSFYYLRELPVDFVKIDGSFIQKLPENRNDQILVKALADIAREFGIQTIAEFVEDEETLEILREYRVDFAQGFYIGRPKGKSKTKTVAA